MTNDFWAFDLSKPNNKTWTLLNANQEGIYNTTGIAYPSPRVDATLWLDSNGDAWIYGGYNTETGYLGDLWKFVSQTEWKWIGGSSLPNSNATYPNQEGLFGVPGARSGACGWTDTDGSIWIYGGQTQDPTGISYCLPFFSLLTIFRQ